MQGLLLLVALAGGAPALRDAAEREAGRPVMLDPRVAVPPCAEGHRFELRGAHALLATCPTTGWTLLLPLAGQGQARSAEPLVRRGDPVRVTAQGAGYEVRIEGVAVTSGGAGSRVRVKLPQGNQLVAAVGPDGELTLAGSR